MDSTKDHSGSCLHSVCLNHLRGRTNYSAWKNNVPEEPPRVDVMPAVDVDAFFNTAASSSWLHNSNLKEYKPPGESYLSFHLTKHCYDCTFTTEPISCFKSLDLCVFIEGAIGNSDLFIVHLELNPNQQRPTPLQESVDGGAARPQSGNRAAGRPQSQLELNIYWK